MKRSSELAEVYNAYETVANLLNRQESVLKDLEDLDARIEAVIRDTLATRENSSVPVPMATPEESFLRRQAA